MLSYEIPGRPWESVKVDFSSINNKHYICALDYDIMFQAIKQVKGLSADNLIIHSRSEYRLSSRLISDTGTHFVPEKFHDFCRCLNIHHVVPSSYNHQSNLLQIRSTLIGPGLPSPTTLLLNQPVRDLTLKFSWPPMAFDNDESNHVTLTKRQPYTNVDIDTCKTGYTLAIQHKERGPWTHDTIAGMDMIATMQKFQIHLTLMGHIITRTKRQVKINPLIAEEYVRNKA